MGGEGDGWEVRGWVGGEGDGWEVRGWVGNNYVFNYCVTGTHTSSHSYHHWNQYITS